MADSTDALRTQIEAMYADRALERSTSIDETLAAFRDALNRGEVRAAHWDAEWKTNIWVKKGLAVLARLGRLVSSQTGAAIDLDTLPARRLSVGDGLRVFDSSYFLRDGAHIVSGCTLMPQAMIQAGAFVGAQTVIGQGAGIGVCAQIGARVHLNAGVQIQGQLEPLELLPAIVEDDVNIGANSVIGSGVIIGSGVFIFPGTTLTRQIRIYDPVRKHSILARGSDPLVIPRHAVVMPGSRSLAKGETQDLLLSVQVAVIAGYSNEANLPDPIVDRLLDS